MLVERFSGLLSAPRRAYQQAYRLVVEVVFQPSGDFLRLFLAFRSEFPRCVWCPLFRLSVTPQNQVHRVSPLLHMIEMLDFAYQKGFWSTKCSHAPPNSFSLL